MRDPRVGLAGGGGGEARARRSPPTTRTCAWLKARLAPLVGAGGEPAAQEESFTAWRRFLESLAGRARDGARVRGPALGGRGAARLPRAPGRLGGGGAAAPPLHGPAGAVRAAPGFGADARNAHAINLAPLTEEETARLVASLLERAVLPAETQQALLERAGGNPLYAEEFVRLLADRGELGRARRIRAGVGAGADRRPPGHARPGAEEPAPGRRGDRQGVLGGRARRDGRARPARGGAALHELARKELVRPARTSSMEGEARVRLLARARAGRLLRADPARRARRRHRAAAAWIERKAGERAEDLADVLAHHYLTALELARPPATPTSGGARAPAMRYLALAGERALALDVDAGGGADWPARSSSPRRPSASALPARALGQAAHSRAGRRRPGTRSRRRSPSTATRRRRRRRRPCPDALSARAPPSGRPARGRRAQRGGRAARSRAARARRSSPPTPSWRAGTRRQCRDREAIAAAERALAARRRARPARAGTRARLPRRRPLLPGRPGGPRGHAPGARARARAGLGRDAAVIHNNLALAIWLYEGPEAALAASATASPSASGAASPSGARHRRPDRRTFLAASSASRSRRWPRLAGSPTGSRRRARHRRRRVALRAAPPARPTRRAPTKPARPPVSSSPRARGSGEPQLIAIAFAAAAELLLAHGRPEQARRSWPSSTQLPAPQRRALLRLAAARARAHRARSRGPPARSPARRRRRTARTALRTTRSAPAAPSSPKQQADHAEAAALYAKAPSAGASSGTCPNAPTPCSATAAAWESSGTTARSIRCAKRASFRLDGLRACSHRGRRAARVAGGRGSVGVPPRAHAARMREGDLARYHGGSRCPARAPHDHAGGLRRRDNQAFATSSRWAARRARLAA